MRDQGFDDNESVWVAEAAEPRLAPALAGRHATDVAVVGGGLTGVSTAWELRRRHPALGVALLEAGTLGRGASGRNGGQVLHGINGVEPTTPEEMSRVHAATGAGIDLAEALAARFAPGAFRRQGCLELYTDARRAERAHARVEAMRAAGIEVEFVPGSALRVRGARGAILDPRAGRLHAFALLQAMRGALLAAGVELHERSPVRRVRLGREIALETPGGELRARSLVLATGAETPELGFFRNGVVPLHSHVIATGPLDERLWERIGWGRWDGLSDDYDRIAYACRTPGGRLLFGGGGNPAYAYRFGGAGPGPLRTDDRPARFLRGAMLRYFPDLAGVAVEHRWAGALDLSFDRVCSMGVGGEHRNLYHALGYSGHGLALALLAGRVLADLHDGNHEPWRELPFYQKRLPPFPPEPLRWLGYQALTRLTGRSPRRRS